MRYLLALLLIPSLALAQSVPNGGVSQSQIWTVNQWITAWTSKADVSGGTLNNPTLIGPSIQSPLTLNITGITQCLHVNASGVVSGTGVDCGAGGGGTAPASATVLGSNSSSQIIAASTSGTGSVVLSQAPSITGSVLDSTTQLDALNTTDVQAAAIVGTIPSTSLPGSSVRYNAPSTCTVSSTDNGNIINEGYGGALSTCTIPDINTSGIIPNAFQTGILNQGVNAMLLTRTTSSLINGQVSIPFAPGAGALVFADANNSTLGNYNYNAFITGEFAGSQPMAVWHDWSQSGTNISDWGMGTITGTNGQFCLYALKDQGYAGGFASGGSAVFCATRGASGSSTGQGVTNLVIGSSVSNTPVSFPGGVVSFTSNIKSPAIVLNGSTPCSTNTQSCIYQGLNSQITFEGVPSSTPTTYAYFDAIANLNMEQFIVSTIQPGESYPAITWTGTGCTGQPTDTTGPAFSATFTNGSASISATNTLSVGQVLTLVGTSATIPAPYSPGTFYYVISTGLSSSAFELSLTNGGSSVGAVTGTTATVTVAQAGNYYHTGGPMTGSYTIPSTGTYVTACIMKLTFTQAAPWGYKCKGDDETAVAQLTQAGHTQLSCSLQKGTAVAAGDVLSYMSNGY